MELPESDYRRIMGKLGNSYDVLREGPWNPSFAQETRGLLANLDPDVSPGRSQGLIGGLERILKSY